MKCTPSPVARASAVLVALLFAGCLSGRNPASDGGGMHCPSNCAQCDGATGKCQDCSPGVNVCHGLGEVVYCNDNGTFGTLVKTCDVASGEKCAAAACLSRCDVAAGAHDYIGCDYWPVTTMNAVLNPAFDFAVAVANPREVGDVVESAPATVKVTRGGKLVATKTVMPGAVETIILPWVRELSQNQVAEKSVLLPDGAYHLTSSLPVTVYQFNPLQYEKPESKDCMDLFSLDGNCHSYSNDASLLLPTAALRRDYLVVARQTFAINQGGMSQAIPGFFAVVGTEDGTQVTVTYSAYTESGSGVSAQTPKSTKTYTLDAGAVLEVASKRASSPCAHTASDANGSYCDMGPQYDLTGTRIAADKPIAVFGGHSCSFVPFDKWACDHLETQLTPIDTWGQKVIVAQTEPQIASEPNVWRVISASDGNQVTFDPPSVHPGLTLANGAYIDFVAEGGFQVTGTGRIAVAQYMVGENYVSDNGVDVGDPSLGLGVPVEQYRTSYDFLTPSTYTKSYVNMIAPAGASLTLDGKPVQGGWKSIGASGYGYRRLEIAPGAHHVTSGEKFGITVSGVASYTSYLYSGGLNLNDVPVQ